MYRARAFVVCATLSLLASVIPSPSAAAASRERDLRAPMSRGVEIQSYGIHAQRVTSDGLVPWAAGGVTLGALAHTNSVSQIVPDGAGGAIVAWEDYDVAGPILAPENVETYYNHDIRLQRVAAGGTALWGANGIAVCTAVPAQLYERQFTCALASDGAGGCIIAWTDPRAGSGNADIYAQRFSAAGTALWTPGGVAVCTASGDQATPAMVADGAGGAIVTWCDYRNTNGDVYAQRLNSGGSAQWTAGGVALCAAASFQLEPVVAADGAGGAFATWWDYRNGFSGNPDIYAQSISAAGAVRWTADGAAACNAARWQKRPAIVSDGAGGAIVVWQDARVAMGLERTYAQRIGAGGAVQWTADGIALCPGVASQQLYPAAIPDGAGGAIAAWTDRRSDTGDVYAQRVSGDGALQWTTSGALVCGGAGEQRGLVMAADGAGGAVLAWRDGRNGTDAVYAQRISAAGALQWAAGGVGLCTAGGAQRSPAIATDGAGGAIVSWSEDPPASGDVPGGPGDIAFALDPVRPNPSRGGSLSVRFTLAGAAPATLELLDVAGRRLAAREVGSLGAGRHTLSLGDGAPLRAGIYLVRLRQGGQARVVRTALLR